jgi:dienelactone hydrolase
MFPTGHGRLAGIPAAVTAMVPRPADIGSTVVLHQPRAGEGTRTIDVRQYTPSVDFLKPFVLPVAPRVPERHDSLDLYVPDDVVQPRPVVLFVPGGPLPAEVQPRPRDWPVFQGYASLVAARGVVGAVVDHRLHSPDAFATAATDVQAAIESLRSDPRVDAQRLALWFFSGGGLLAADWLREPPAWLRMLALSYPLLAPFPGWPVSERFDPIGALASTGDLPIVLTRVGREHPGIAEAVGAFVDASSKARLEIVDVPEGRHSFDVLDNDDASRDAIVRAADLVTAALVRPVDQVIRLEGMFSDEDGGSVS